MIIIHNFPASYGDTFIIEIQDATFDAVNILVDCGKGFKSGAQKYLEKMGLDRAHKIDRFIITHFDDDHIAGAYNFLKENGDPLNPSIIEIKQIWLNTFRHLQFKKRKPGQLSATETNKLNLFKSAFPSVSESQEESEIGAAQALLAGQIIFEKGYDWNTDFGGQACIAPTKITIAENVTLHLLTPSVEKLEAIETFFINKLNDDFGLNPTQEDIFDDAFELFLKSNERLKMEEIEISAGTSEISVERIDQLVKTAEYTPDLSPGNGSSISFIIETSHRKLLFLADAHAEDVIQALEKIFTECKRPIHFDAIKIAHHGSFRNNKPELFKLIDSDKFIFSTNGKHPKHIHPDVETIAHIVSRPLPSCFSVRTLYFNHSFVEKQVHLAALEKKELQDKFNYKISMEREISI
ncbi:hypothetical protein N180_15550 [Pedobacter antarcticus 4BY]|uniref:Metallo-beta-lactamase domain-containing protein n=2 Tax=Pedobacter antarcticus TaxID=34086 RepID=A0A081PLS8_9SPHI|nr:hypothetical protein [Pedobacter antarcticus]KEQ31651.1 hypothetical protein N180_15550 [Pedobacter antarcticus 4BY]SFE33717.1 hypothetical protein SAMN03003324_00128 [Pedobacter antarcticus]